ncbi:hypothetical protein DE146DRAFT_603328 [Phaeosphaeria sp. MPI-PUGE-AT-0046c]|nr:hypothetical protein DE146DRAFT_603328 [Phaeosphaeria sp. MPI-PUGE-AT-0046c]
MLRRIDTLSLHELTLDTFTGAEELFEAMASQFGNGKPCLKKLFITNLPRQTTEQFVVSFFVFLASFSGIQKLYLRCEDCHKIDVDGIANHGEHLKYLFIVNGGIHRKDSERCFDASDLQKLAIACPKLEYLCLNLYEIDSDGNESDVLGAQVGVDFNPNGFEEALRAVAGMKSLRTIKLTNPPEYRKAFHRPGDFLRYFFRNLQEGTERYRFQARADGIMQYLGQCGSNIQGLAFTPVGERLRKAEYPDRKGHIWPNYFYQRRTATDGKGPDVAFAEPIVDWDDRFPGDSI